jgi:2-polyprenyl-3-methyl-5-hydroxy-6-metoxy-1,4-benzoquinol methylase
MQFPKGQKPYMPVVIGLIEKLQPGTILDVGAGGGWLGKLLGKRHVVDAIDWLDCPPPGTLPPGL